MSRVIPVTTTLITAATELPFDVQWAKDHIRAIGSAEDILIESWIKAATQYFEEQTGHQIMEATFEDWLDAFTVDTMIELRRPPLREVESVKYLDSSGSEVSFTDGGSPELPLWSSRAPAGVPARLGWVEVNSGSVWPTPLVTSGAVRIRYTAGYATTSEEVPDLIKAALAMILAQYEQFRSEIHLSDRSAKLEQLPTGAAQIMRGFWASALPSRVPRTLL